MPRRLRTVWAFLVAAVSVAPLAAVTSAQTVMQRGFVEGSLFVFPQAASNDPTRAVADILARDELFFKPAPWV
ncbi:MAG: hypothetical protein ACRD2I_20060, partial [Vicinamibacterales bacterium]